MTYDINPKGWLKILITTVIIVAGIVGCILLMSSCKINRRIEKENVKTDTSSVVTRISKTSVYIDSSKRTSILTNVDFSDSSVIKSSDDYEKTKINYYNTDSAGRMHLVKSETKTKGKKTTIKNVNKKQKSNTVDTTNHTNIYQATAETKDSSAQEGSKETDKKKGDSEAKTTFGFTFIIIGGVIALLLVLFAVYKRYRSKLKLIP